MHWYVDVLKKYAVFSGRARRQEYWMFFLFYFIIMIVLSVVEGIVGSAGILGMIYGLAVLCPSVAVAIRRLHDTDRSGWWCLIGLIPLIGIVLLVFMVLEGTSGENQYGPDPKAETA